MARSAPYLFFRYELTFEGKSIEGPRHKNFLEPFKGREVAHRKANPTSEDLDTFLLRLRSHNFSGATVLSWRVAVSLTVRQVDRYDVSADDLSESFETTNECQSSQFVAIPALSVLAVEDRVSGRHLGEGGSCAVPFDYQIDRTRQSQCGARWRSKRRCQGR